MKIFRKIAITGLGVLASVSAVTLGGLVTSAVVSHSDKMQVDAKYGELKAYKSEKYILTTLNPDKATVEVRNINGSLVRVHTFTPHTEHMGDTYKLSLKENSLIEYLVSDILSELNCGVSNCTEIRTSGAYVYEFMTSRSDITVAASIIDNTDTCVLIAADDNDTIVFSRSYLITRSK